MSLISPDLTGIVDGSVGDAADWTTPMNTLINVINGGLDTTNMTASALALPTVAQSVALATWSPTFTGVSVQPTVAAYYQQVGSWVIVDLNTSVPGTSNATTKTFNLPVAAKRVSYYLCSQAQDNGSNLTGVAQLVTAAGSTTASLFKDPSGAAWTNANGWFVKFSFVYEAA